MQGQSPSPSIPLVWCDFNACGWAGNGDSCYYALDRERLKEIAAHEDMQVFLYDVDEPGTIFGCVAKLEPWTHGTSSGWRAQPIPGTEYSGPEPAHFVHGSGA